MSKRPVLARSIADKPSATATTWWPSSEKERSSERRKSVSSSTTKMLSGTSFAALAGWLDRDTLRRHYARRRAPQ
jgi:hypothetical protein